METQRQGLARYYMAESAPTMEERGVYIISRKRPPLRRKFMAGQVLLRIHLVDGERVDFSGEENAN